ncbi:DUF1295 domain-containing protein [Xylophilus rhododendri]|uniref:DUF1295 domain-containing protein n=1 Tax=Xylophilus rhododendri TaxID=2697032 RepID=A0A857IYP5_9BURK|nr:DUF1295 domain-containing protein [Xylophilus rhododendri]QHI96690.1 DUF1295 domain-containing protein [Xylophilus rhododendri]
MSGLSIALCGLAASAALALLTWIASLLRHDVSLVDRTWGLMIAAPGIVYAALLPDAWPRAAWLLPLLLAWAIRLAWHVTRRNWGHGEERRYQAIRARNQPGFAFKSLYLVFALQAVLAWAVAAPLFAAFVGGRDFGWLDAAGVALAGFGIVFEAVSDAQLSRFLGDPAHKGQVMDRGLWRYSRHPNYFGECCTWWGMFLLGLAGAGVYGWWALVSPVVMTVLLLKVSGVSLLEADIGERRPKYRDYVARTPAFFPWRPRAR